MPLDRPPHSPADLGAVGAVARAPKRASATPPTLTSFSVKKGDNGGLLVCETYERTAPEGRRQGAAYPGGGDYKENPFGPDDAAKAASYVGTLLRQMAPAPAPAPAAAAIAPPRMGPGPSVAAVSPSRVTAARPGAIASVPRPVAPPAEY